MASNVDSLSFLRGHPMFGPMLKVQRAERHIQETKATVAAFFARNPYGIGIKTNPQTGHRTYYLIVREDIPDELGLQIGDVVHNLRSAFDLIACQVVGLGTGNVSQAQFPVFASAEKFDGKFSRYIGGAPQHAVDVIKRLQPYHGGHNQPLWNIHKLDILDKHRMIVPVGTAHRNIGVDSSAIFSQLLGKEVTVPTYSLRPANRQFPLKDGASLLTVGAATDGEIEPDYRVTIEISFGEPEALKGEPISPALEQLVEFTARAVQMIGKEVFS